MQIFYHTINTLVTDFYYVCLILLLSNIVDHKKNIYRTVLIYIGLNIVTAIMTETAVPVLIKVYVHMLYLSIMYRFLLSEKTAAVAMHVVYFWFICAGVQEDIIIFFCKINHIVPWVDVGHGVQLGKARVILISSVFMLVLTLLLKHILKPFSEVMESRNIWLLVISGIIFHGLEDTLWQMFYQYAEGYYLILGIVLITGVAFIAVLLCIFFYRFLYVEKREREERIQREVLEKQFVYYQDKQKDEERVRSIYHDMKNHLLVLEHQIHSPETAEMVEKLQREVESYADYVHTGNDFLDVILKDKAGIAREKQIDFSATVDLQGIDFIEPLDISTIFGNGLDNAIEASEKLPEGQRVIQVKACRVQNFLSIMMENNCQEESGQKKKRSSKKDDYFHGFGISNMKNAAEQYGGQLTVKCEEGKFTLNILIPIR
ncbi:MAG: GHKL domain-containing protein [Lachnospiraceae bacterium]|nr:GHKL domain-containing protein [Lachnospiraceae bacterium]